MLICHLNRRREGQKCIKGKTMTFKKDQWALRRYDNVCLGDFL